MEPGTHTDIGLENQIWNVGIAAQIVAAKAEGDVGDKLIDASIASLKDQLN